MPSRNTIEIIINATDNASKIISDISKNTSKIGALATAGIVASVGLASTAISGLAVKGVQEFMKFEQGMQEVFSLLPGISQDAMDKMSNQVDRLSAQFGVLPEQTIPALYEALSAGIPQDTVFNFLEIANKAAIAGVTDLTTAVNGISSAMNAYGYDILSAEKASDVMFQTVKFGKTTFDELSNSLYNVSPTAASLGVTFEDLNAQIAAITAQGTPTSVATNQMRQMFVELSKDGGKTADMFKELAGKTFKQFIAEGGNTQDALQLLEQYAKDTGVGLNDLFSSVEAGSAALSLTGRNTERFSQFLSEMANASGATDEAFKTMSKSLQFQVNRLNAKFSIFLKTIGEKLAPSLGRPIEVIGNFISFLTDLIDGVTDFTDIAEYDMPKALQKVALALANVVKYTKMLFNGFREVVQSSTDFIEFYNNLSRVIMTLSGNNVILTSRIMETITMFKYLKEIIGLIFKPVMDFIKENVKLQDVLVAIGIAIASFVVPAIISVGVALAPILGTFALLVTGSMLLRKAWNKNFLGIRDTVGKVTIWITDRIYEVQQILKRGVDNMYEDVNQSFISKIARKMKEIKNTLSLDSILSKLGGGTSSTFIDSLIVKFNKLKGAVVPLFNAIKEAISKIDFGQLFEIGKTLLSLTSPLGIIKTLFETTFQVSIFDLFIEGINKVTFFIEKLNSGASIYEALGVKQESEIGTFITNIIGFFKDAVNFVQTKVIPALQNFGNWFLKEALPAIVNFVVNTALPAINRFFGWLAETWENVRPSLENIANWFINTALPSIVNFVTGTVIPRINDLITIISDIWNAVSPALTELAIWFIQDALPQIVNFINNTVIPVIQDITTIISDIWTMVQPTLQSLYDWFVTTGLPAISNFIKDVVIVQVQGFIDILKGIWDFVRPGLTALKNNMANIFGWISNNIVNPLLTKINELRNTLISLGLIQGQTSLQMAQGLVNSKLNNAAFEASKFGYGTGINSYGGFGGTYANGLPYVPRDMMVGVHRGERILTADENKGNIGSTINNTIQISLPNVTNQNEADKQTRLYVNALRNSGVDL